MSESNTNYGVSCIASAPNELKVGDRVEIVDKEDNLYQETAIVVFVFDDGGIKLLFGENSEYIYDAHQLRKRPDTISFEEDSDNPMDKQIGGNHYKDMAIQPVEFCMKNNLNFCVSSAIKYLCRYKNKNGKQDLEKARHFIDLLIQMEYPNV